MCEILNIGTREPEVDTPEYEQDEKLIEDVYNGKTDVQNLPNSLYLFSFFNLTRYLKTEFGLPTDFKEGSFRHRRATAAKENLSRFAGSKTFHNVMGLSLEVFAEDGSKMPFNEFKKIGLSVNSTYNQTWLKTEQNAAFRQAQAIESWADVNDNADVLPLLRYSSVGDARVRDDHAEIDGVTKPVDDPFWNSWFPPNGFNCRCVVEQVESGKVTKRQFQENDDLSFGQNVGKSGIIFPKNSPFFTETPRQFKSDQKNNFGFKTPSDKAVNKFIDKNES